MDRYLKKMAIVRKSYQGAHSLEGNQSRLFLKKIDSLQRELELLPDSIIINGLPFITAFRAFSEVVDSCFGVVLKPDYIAKIQNFKTAYMALDITVTPKAHIVFQHIAEFLSRVNAGENLSTVGLGYFSEQAFEAMHHDVKVIWEKVKVGLDHPNFSEKLRSFVVAYNSKHL